MVISDELTEHFRINEAHKKALKKLGIETVEDLLFHLPTRYENISDVKPVTSLEKGDSAVVFGNLHSLSTRKAFRKKTPIAEGYIEDTSGKIKVIWFHQPYIAKMVRNGSNVKLSGKVTGSDKSLYIANPEVENIDSLPIDISGSLFKKESGFERSIYPVYKESKGITSKWIFHKINDILKDGALENLEDSIPESILKQYYLPSLKSALIWVHMPKKEKDSVSARKRFAFEEVFFIQLVKQKQRLNFEKKKSFKINTKQEDIKEFIKRFPFKITGAQQHAIDAIVKDFKTPHAMARLLEGDVGSGKTAVAAATVYSATTTRPDGQDFGNLQTAYMAPTEILAKQLFESFIEYFSHLPINIGLITSSGCKKFPSKVNAEESTAISKPQLLKWVENGEIPILIGTHSLIQKSVKFKNLAYVIIDEQHRFGTAQRQRLTRKDEIVPHLLSMTATPIPRTLALTIYGDLDLTLLDEMPAGRKPVITETVMPTGRKNIYEKIREELKKGRQLYVICPRIDEPDPEKQHALNVKSVKEEAKRLKKEVFSEYEVDILHSKMSPKEKEATMNEFLNNEIQILVATSVVEVGVNVPNATVIIIEGAERFGLAQLHQLRGRVLRSTHQAYCFVFADSKTKKTVERLKALQMAKNGFELAEFDLSIRGSGELYGKNQSGLTDIGMEAMKNVKLVEAARTEARKIVEEDSDFKKYPNIKKKIEGRMDSLHLE